TMPVFAGTNTLRVVVTRRDKTWDSASITVVGHVEPIVVFTSPTSTTFDAPATINLGVDAVSPVGSISKVEFLRNGGVIGTATSPPYRYVWDNVGSGNHSLSAVGTDDNGHTGMASSAVSVGGANTPPTVGLTAPPSGAVFDSPATVAMTAAASDADGSVTKVEFLQNGAVVGITNVAPYGVTLS